MVSGYYRGRVDRHYDVAENGRLFESILFDLEGDPAIYQYLQYMTRFAEETGVRYWMMSPTEKALKDADKNIFCMANEGVEYLIYFATGGSATLPLSDSLTYQVRWYNPRTGEFVLNECHKGTIQLTAPDEGDWAVYVTAE